MTERDLEDRTDAALAEEGLAEHGYRAEFRDLALMMLRFFLSNRAGAVVEPPVALSLTFGGEEIIVRPDEVLVRPDGVRAVRRIRTGHLRSAESKDVGAAALILAVKQAFPGAVAELVHLSDGEVHLLSLSDRELKGRKDKLAKVSRRHPGRPVSGRGLVAHLSELPGLLHLRADPRRPPAKKVRLTLPVGQTRSDWTLRAAASPRQT